MFDELSLDELKLDDGFDKLVEFMTKHLGKDDLDDALAKFEMFEDYIRENESIDTFIDNFDLKYHKILKKGMKLPSEILAFKLLRKAKITRDEKLLVLTGMDYSKKDTLYDQCKKSLRKFKGGAAMSNSVTSGATPAIKLEPAFLAQHEDVLWSAGYARRGGSRGYTRGGGSRGNYRGYPGVKSGSVQ